MISQTLLSRNIKSKGIQTHDSIYMKFITLFHLYESSTVKTNAWWKAHVSFIDHLEADKVTFWSAEDLIPVVSPYQKTLNKL